MVRCNTMNTTNSIKLRNNNLYRNGRVIRFSDGDELLIRKQVTLEGTLTDNYHVLKKGERLDQLAWKYYKMLAKDASKYWWLIADANKIYNPMELDSYIGQELLIPNLTKAIVRL